MVCLSKACLLRMLCQNVARGCTSAGVYVGCVELPAYCSVVDMQTICVPFTRYRTRCVEPWVPGEFSALRPFLSLSFPLIKSDPSSFEFVVNALCQLSCELFVDFEFSVCGDPFSSEQETGSCILFFP